MGCLPPHPQTEPPRGDSTVIAAGAVQLPPATNSIGAQMIEFLIKATVAAIVGVIVLSVVAVAILVASGYREPPIGDRIARACSKTHGPDAYSVNACKLRLIRRALMDRENERDERAARDAGL